MRLKLVLRILLVCALLRGSALLHADAQAAEPGKSGSGTFVSFRDGTLTIQDKARRLVYEKVGADYKTYQNNEDGPGSRKVDTFEALSRVLPGAVFRVDAEGREIYFGLDHRVIGAFESYQDGKLRLLSVDVPPGFVQEPKGDLILSIDPGIPILESIEGAPYRHVGAAGEILKNVRRGTLVTARSEYDVGIFEVIQLGEPKRKIERYVGQTRGTVRGTLVSFKDSILRIRGKGIASPASNEYERLIGVRILENIPIVESIDGGAYQPADLGALKAAKEGAVITVRKIEEVVLEIQIGVPK